MWCFFFCFSASRLWEINIVAWDTQSLVFLQLPVILWKSCVIGTSQWRCSGWAKLCSAEVVAQPAAWSVPCHKQLLNAPAATETHCSPPPHSRVYALKLRAKINSLSRKSLLVSYSVTQKVINYTKGTKTIEIYNAFHVTYIERFRFGIQNYT